MADFSELDEAAEFLVPEEAEASFSCAAEDVSCLDELADSVFSSSMFISVNPNLLVGEDFADT